MGVISTISLKNVAIFCLPTTSLILKGSKSQVGEILFTYIYIYKYSVGYIHAFRANLYILILALRKTENKKVN